MRLINYDEYLQAKRATEKAQDVAFLAYLRWGRVEENEITNLMRSVDALELCTRSANSIENARMGIRTVYDLVQKTPKDLLRVRNFGRKSLQEIEGVLASMGLRLGMVFPGWTKPGAAD
jgi:DNA-directed RNA polymerase alpha subunit